MTTSYFTIKLTKALDDNTILLEKLLETTNKQHQEMSRAIELNEKNIKLKLQVDSADEEFRKLQELNTRLKNLTYS